MSDLQLFVDFVLHRESVAVPAKSPFNVVSGLGGVPADHVFNGSCCDVTIVGGSGGERRTVIKGIRRKVLGLLELLLEGVDLLPIVEDSFFFLREGYLFRGYMIGKRRILKAVS